MRKSFDSRQLALGAAVTVALASQATYAVVTPAVLTPTADAEIRETQPEFTRGAVPTSGTQLGELQISTTTGTPNRNLGLIRFTLPSEITTGADLGGYADLRLFTRLNMNTGAGSSLRLYALRPNHPLNTLWNEGEVMYRDTGSHQNPNPVIGGPQTNTTPSVISQSAPPAAPISGVAGYGADPLHARRAPGIRFENAPFSAQVEAENQARVTYNAANDPDLPYINQPNYNISPTTVLAVTNAISTGDGNPATTGDGFTDIYSDIPLSNRPFFSGATQTYLDDLEPGDWTKIGHTTVSGTVTAGSYIHFGADVGAENTSQARLDSNVANLLAFLGTWLDDPGDYHTFTFMIAPGLGGANGELDEFANTINQQWASKEFIPPSGLQGTFAPLLFIAPEPGTMAMLAIGSILGLRRRRA